MPTREIRERFTKSELVIMGWRGSEMSYNMDNKINTPMMAPRDGGYEPTHAVTQSDDLQRLEERLGPVAVKMVDERGRVDLRKLTGAEALHYMGALGIPITHQLER